MSTAHAREVASSQRFEFGKNWARFLAAHTPEHAAQAEASLREMLGVQDLSGKTFVDAGSGSGLFSLAARRLGARVRSFDFDPQSVACTMELKRRYFDGDKNWTVEEGSVLDTRFLASLGQFDVVYSWGVLHHTGSMWKALENVIPLVKEGGTLFIAIYNDQGRSSRFWLTVKKTYNRLPRGFRWMILWPAAIRLWGPTIIRDLVAGSPFRSWRNYSRESLRGMSPWRDVVDWVGGLPFEVATPEWILRFYRDRGFQLEELKTCAGGHGCNEFVFRKVAGLERARECPVP
jgi:2-polyprenyl-6-hydroxyphenyl methylase/3-demethylubiquinone-9 3-methyltransferase